MAHYAFLDENNIVVDVIVGKEEGEDNIDWEEFYGNFRGLKCKRTSYNTLAGKHLNNGIPFRKNYAMIGGTYDETRDAFIPPKPSEDFVLNEDSCTWELQIPYPEDGKDYSYWDSNNGCWIETPNPDPI